MSARRRSGVAVVRDDDASNKGMVEIFVERHKDNLEMLAPFVGAAVGAMALEAASQHVTMQKHELALVGAGLAFLAGANAKGPTRQLALGAAAGAACYGVVEVLRAVQPAWLYKQVQPNQAQRQAAPADGITRAELESALGELQRRHQAELAARDAAHADQMRELKKTYEAQLGEMQSTMHTLLNELRRERGQPPVEMPPKPVVDEPPPRSPNDNVASVTSISSATPPVTRDQAAHFGAIYALLTAEERVRVSAMIASASPTLLATVQRDLMAMTPDRAVAHLRRNMFPSATAA